MASYRLLTYRAAEGPRAGLAVGDAVADIAAGTGRAADATMLGVLEDWSNARSRLAILADCVQNLSVATKPLSSLTLLSPVLYPGAIYCAGANYADHVAAMAAKQGVAPDANPKLAGLKPWHFIKPSRTAVGQGAEIAVESAALDWEIELAAVIGTTARHVSIESALDHVAGYTVANDLSARDLSRRPGVAETSPFRWDWIGQKCFDGSCPLGPWITPADQIGDPMNLPMRLWVNDTLKQNSNTGQMIFNIADQISHLSSRLTLYPGDVVLTGTPSGVGAERGEFLKAGDVMRVEIEGIGVLVNTVRSVTGA